MFLYPWDFAGENIGVGCHFLLQGIFPTQELNSGSPEFLLNWQVYSLPLHPLGRTILYGIRVCVCFIFSTSTLALIVFTHFDDGHSNSFTFFLQLSEELFASLLHYFQDLWDKQKAMSPWYLPQTWGLLPSIFGEGNDNPLQYSRLEKPMDGGAW